MKCPVCNTELQIAVRAGIEIDYCPNCRGVWLDRGELDKIIERHVQETQSLMRGASSAPASPPAPTYSAPPRPQPRYEDDDEYYYDEYHKRRRRKKRDWFEDLFDIFD
ncbi:MAG: zf-TFIIB domain-containing protein [Fimbriimonadales bacterium]|nr:zf-TFIIB domain-containing protein [Fimbriimonadales bacterium]